MLGCLQLAGTTSNRALGRTLELGLATGMSETLRNIGPSWKTTAHVSSRILRKRDEHARSGCGVTIGCADPTMQAFKLLDFTQGAECD